ncbi:hypothetical protein HRG_014174 [Hirsutella rhossiliensis]
MVKIIGAPNPGRKDPPAGLSVSGSMLEISLCLEERRDERILFPPLPCLEERRVNRAAVTTCRAFVVNCFPDKAHFAVA